MSGISQKLLELHQLRDAISALYKSKKYETYQIDLLYWKICNYEYDKNDDTREILECYSDYIDIVLKYLETENFQSSKVYKSKISKYMSIIADIQLIPPLIKNSMVDVTSKILERVTDPSIKPPCAKELTRAYNNIIKSCDKSVKEKLVNSGIGIYLLKLIDILCSCGDFEYQTFLLETIFRVCPNTFIKSKAADFFPEAESLQAALIKFDVKYFDSSRRIFLNIVNSVFGDVFSFVAQNILLDEVNVEPPIDAFGKRQQLWIDFNKTTETIGIYCEQSCLKVDMLSQDDDESGWELITIFVSDVGLVETKRSNKSQTAVLFKFTLTNPFYVQYPGSEAITKSKFLRVVVIDPEVVRELQETVFPGMFKNKFQNTRNEKKRVRVSSLSRRDSFKGNYKPLNIRIRKSVGSRSITSADTRSIKSLDDVLNVRPALNGSKAVEMSSDGPNCDLDTQYFSAQENSENIIRETPKGGNSLDISVNKSDEHDKFRIKMPFVRKCVFTRKISLDPAFSPILETSEISHSGKIHELARSKQNEINQELGESVSSEVDFSSVIFVSSSQDSKSHKKKRESLPRRKSFQYNSIQDSMDLDTQGTNQLLRKTRTYTRKGNRNSNNTKDREEARKNNFLCDTMSAIEDAIQTEKSTSNKNKNIIQKNCDDVVNVNCQASTLENSQYLTAPSELEISINEHIQVEKQVKLVKASPTFSKAVDVCVNEIMNRSQKIQMVHAEECNHDVTNENIVSIISKEKDKTDIGNKLTMTQNEVEDSHELNRTLKNTSEDELAVSAISANVTVRENKVPRRNRNKIACSQKDKKLKIYNSYSSITSKPDTSGPLQTDLDQTSIPSQHSIREPSKRNKDKRTERQSDKRLKTSCSSSEHTTNSKEKQIPLEQINENIEQAKVSDVCVIKNDILLKKSNQKINFHDEDPQQENSKLNTTSTSNSYKLTESDDDSTFVDESLINENNQEVHEPNGCMHGMPVNKESVERIKYDSMLPVVNKQILPLENEVIDLTQSDDVEVPENVSGVLVKPLEDPDSDMSSQVISGNNTFAIKQNKKLKSRKLRKLQTANVKNVTNIVLPPETNKKAIQDEIIKNNEANKKSDCDNVVCLKDTGEILETNAELFIETQNSLFDQFIQDERNNKIRLKDVETIIEKQVLSDNAKGEITNENYGVMSVLKGADPLLISPSEDARLNHHFQTFPNDNQKQYDSHNENLSDQENLRNSYIKVLENNITNPLNSNEHRDIPPLEVGVSYFQKKTEKVNIVEEGVSKMQDFKTLTPNKDEQRQLRTRRLKHVRPLEGNILKLATETTTSLKEKIVTSKTPPTTRGRKNKKIISRDVHTLIEKHVSSDETKREVAEENVAVNVALNRTDHLQTNKERLHDSENENLNNQEDIRNSYTKPLDSSGDSDAQISEHQGSEKVNIIKDSGSKRNQPKTLIPKEDNQRQLRKRLYYVQPLEENTLNERTLEQITAIQDEIIKNNEANKKSDCDNVVCLKDTGEILETNAELFIETQNSLFDQFIQDERNNKIRLKDVETIIEKQVLSDNAKGEITNENYGVMSVLKGADPLLISPSEDARLNHHFQTFPNDNQKQYDSHNENLSDQENLRNSYIKVLENNITNPLNSNEHRDIPPLEVGVSYFQRNTEKVNIVEEGVSKMQDFETLTPNKDEQRQLRTRRLKHVRPLEGNILKLATETTTALEEKIVTSKTPPTTRGRKNKKIISRDVHTLIEKHVSSDETKREVAEENVAVKVALNRTDHLQTNKERLHDSENENLNNQEDIRNSYTKPLGSSGDSDAQISEHQGSEKVNIIKDSGSKRNQPKTLIPKEDNQRQLRKRLYYVQPLEENTLNERTLEQITVTSKVLPKKRGRKKKHVAEEVLAPKKNENATERSLYNNNTLESSKFEDIQPAELQSSSIINNFSAENEVARAVKDSSEFQNVYQDANNNGRTPKQSDNKAAADKNSMSLANENLQRDQTIKNPLKETITCYNKKRIALTKIYRSNDESKTTRLRKIISKNDNEVMIKPKLSIDNSSMVLDKENVNPFGNEPLENKENDVITVSITKSPENRIQKISDTQQIKNNEQVFEKLKPLNNNNNLFDVNTEEVISHSQRSRSSNGKRKLSQSDTPLYVKPSKTKRFKLFNPNDLTYLEDQASSFARESPNNKSKSNIKAKGVSEKTRTISKRKVKKTSNPKLKSSMEKSFQKEALARSSKKRNPGRKAATADPVTRTDTKRRELFDTFLTSFAEDVDKSKRKYNKRSELKKSNKNVRKHNINTSFDFDENLESETEIWPSKVKILQNIVIQPADAQLNRKNEEKDIHKENFEKMWREILKIFDTINIQRNEMLKVLIKSAPHDIKEGPEYKELLKEQQHY